MENLSRIFAFLGSPRLGGNTDILLNKVIEGIKVGRKNFEIVQKIILNTLKITPCQHCDGCKKEGNCVIEDDMQLLYPKIISADKIIIASPIFFMGLSAQTKAFIDRCQALWVRKYILGNFSLPLRKGLFLAVGGMNKPNVFEGAKITVKIFFKVINVDYTEELLFYGIDEKGAIKNHASAEKDAFLLGQRFAEL